MDSIACCKAGCRCSTTSLRIELGETGHHSDFQNYMQCKALHVLLLMSFVIFSSLRLMQTAHTFNTLLGVGLCLNFWRSLINLTDAMLTKPVPDPINAHHHLTCRQRICLTVMWSQGWTILWMIMVVLLMRMRNCWILVTPTAMMRMSKVIYRIKLYVFKLPTIYAHE